MAIAVHPSVAKSLQELIKRVRASPGKYSYGSTGVGGINHLAGELFKKQTGGLDIVHVPYRSSGQSVQDLVAGQIPIVSGTFSSLVTYHRSGKARILAVFSEKRSDVEPSIPTASEVGVPDMVASTFNVLLAPAGTPKALIEQLHQATMKVMSEAAFQKDLDRLTIEPVTDSNPEKAARFIKSELAKWAPVIKESGIKVQ
jgi:tripartite-type tricarboxylate transporter receptor subunit TctC